MLRARLFWAMFMMAAATGLAQSDTGSNTARITATASQSYCLTGYDSSGVPVQACAQVLLSGGTVGPIGPPYDPSAPGSYAPYNTYPPAYPTVSTPRPVQAASSFLGMWGFNVHSNFSYYGAVTSWMPLYLASGFRRVRDNYDESKNATDALSDFYNAGIKVAWTDDGAWQQQVIGCLPGCTPTQADYDNAAAHARDFLINSGAYQKLAMLLGPNEMNGETHKPLCWRPPPFGTGCVTRWQKAFKAALNADARTKNIPYATGNFNSPGNLSQWQEYAATGCCTQVPLQIADEHGTGGGKGPTCDGGYGPGMEAGGDNYFACMIYEDETTVLPHGTPIINSESGYAALPVKWPSDTTRGYLIWRHALQSYRWNVFADMGYEFVNNPGEDGFGITKNGNPTRSYDVAKAAMTLLADAGTPANLAFLPFTPTGLSGAGPCATWRGVQHEPPSNTTCSRILELQKSNGEYWFIGWEDEEITNDDAHDVQLQATATVTLTFTGSHTYTVYRPITQQQVHDSQPSHGGSNAANLTTVIAGPTTGTSVTYTSEPGPTLIRVQ